MRKLSIVVVTCLALAACGGDSSDSSDQPAADDGPATTIAAPATTTEAADPAATTVAADPATTVVAESTSVEASDAGTGGGSDLVVPDDVCAAVPAAAVGEALGATVVAAAVPGGGCEYTQDDPRATRASIVVLALGDTAGYDAYVAGTEGVLVDPVRTDLPGLGERAVVISGETAAGGFHSTAAIAQAGGAIVSAVVLGGDVAAQPAQAEAALSVALASLT